jgi:hypothetical protein
MGHFYLRNYGLAGEIVGWWSGSGLVVVVLNSGIVAQLCGFEAFIVSIESRCPFVFDGSAYLHRAQFGGSSTSWFWLALTKKVYALKS